MKHLKFRKSQRLRKKWEFHRVYREGVAYHYRFFVGFYLRIEGSKEKKVGIVASRKVGSAVLRNLAKRRLREIYRCHQLEIKEGTHLVLVARKSIVNASASQVEQEFGTFIAEVFGK